MGRDTKAPYQNIVALVVRKCFLSKKHRVEDHVGHREMGQLCGKLRFYNGKDASHAKVVILTACGIK